ncbi:MAG: alpha/beta hydrolase, partial [Flavobacteriaceae bacterium]|nr:alpha/beta hydrolase [Flavobacteriaceae bacterium]
MHNVKKLSIGILLIYVMIGASIFYIQEKLIFLPSKLPMDHAYQMTVPFEELFLESED